MLKLQSYTDLPTIPLGYTHTAKPRKVRYLWTFFFGLIVGDMNPVHIHPIDSFDYKSRFKRRFVRHGISSIAEAESGIFRIFDFAQPIEILAKGYNAIKYHRPVHMGDKITYSYTLTAQKISVEKRWSECTWVVTAANQRNEVVFSAEWIVMYAAIQLEEKNYYHIPFMGTVRTTPGQAIYYWWYMLPIIAALIYGYCRV